MVRGTVWYEAAYPNLLFAKDGEIYTIEGLRHIAIGGAYSVDKYYRLMRGFGWWQDEQPSEEIKEYVERQMASHTVDVIPSHTCPYKYEPIEMFLPGIDQSTVDTSTELWLDQIEKKSSRRTRKRSAAIFVCLKMSEKTVSDYLFLDRTMPAAAAIRPIVATTPASAVPWKRP